MTMTFKVAGNLAADPEFSTFNGGEGVRARLRVATDRPIAEGKFETDFHEVVLFGRTAETLREARKGARVEISGSVRPTSYDKDGERRFSINFIGGRVELAASDSDRGSRSKQRASSTSASASGAKGRSAETASASR